MTPDRTQDRPVRTHAAMWTWLALGVVVALLGTLLLVKVVGGVEEGSTTLEPTSPAVLQEVTGVLLSVSDTVGVTSPAVPVSALTVLRGGALLTAPGGDGVVLPVVFYLGTEFSSFCAAERWSLIVALSRFGTFTSLADMQSSPLDFAPGTPTFSFDGSHYSSTYLVFDPVELESNVMGSDGYKQLMRVPVGLRDEVARYDPTSSYPFIDVANRVVELAAGFSPEALAGLTRDQIAARLDDPTSAVTQAILVAANELTASICHADGEQPAAVCGSTGVRRADSALGLRA